MNTAIQPQDFEKDLVRILENYSITYKECTIYKTTDELFIWNGKEFGSLVEAKKEIDEAANYLEKSIR